MVTKKTQDPGEAFGIAGFVLAFTPIHIVGLILSAVGLAKSRSAGRANGLALAGILLNAIFMALVILGAITVVAYNGVTARANTAAAQSASENVLQHAMKYKEENGVFPITSDDTQPTSVTQILMPLRIAPGNPSTVELYACGGKGIAVGYWDYQKSEAAHRFVGSVTSLDECTFLYE